MQLKYITGVRASIEVNSTTIVQILDEVVCISHSANTLGKGKDPIILPQTVGK